MARETLSLPIDAIQDQVHNTVRELCLAAARIRLIAAALESTEELFSHSPAEELRQGRCGREGARCGRDHAGHRGRQQGRAVGGDRRDLRGGGELRAEGVRRTPGTALALTNAGRVPRQLAEHARKRFSWCSDALSGKNREAHGRTRPTFYTLL